MTSSKSVSSLCSLKILCRHFSDRSGYDGTLNTAGTKSTGISEPEVKLNDNTGGERSMTNHYCRKLCTAGTSQDHPNIVV